MMDNSPAANGLQLKGHQQGNQAGDPRRVASWGVKGASMNFKCDTPGIWMTCEFSQLAFTFAINISDPGQSCLNNSFGTNGNDHEERKSHP